MKKKSLLIVAILTFVLSFAFAACGETETPHVHEYGAYTLVEGSIPTETEAGKATATCSCGETTTVDVPKLTDSTVWTLTTTDATCTADGKKEYTSVYGKVEVTIHATHKLGTLVAATESTCKTQGNVAYYECEACGKYFAEDGTTELTAEQIHKSLAEHAYGSLIPETDSTCTVPGVVAHYHCAVCEKDFAADHTELTSVEKALADHDYGTLIAETESTCQTHGHVAYYECSACGKYFSEDKTELTSIEKPLGNHDYEDQPYTSTAEKHSVKCKYCDNTISEAHAFEAVVNDGLQHSKTCATCKYSVKENHTYDSNKKCTVCEQQLAVFDMQYSSMKGNAGSSNAATNAIASDNYGNGVITFDANGIALPITTKCVGVIKQNDSTYYEGRTGYKVSNSKAFVEYVNKETGEIKFVNVFIGTLSSSGYDDTDGEAKEIKLEYKGYINKTNGIIFLSGKYSPVFMVPSEEPITEVPAGFVGRAFNYNGDLYGYVFYKYTNGEDSFSVYYYCKTEEICYNATVTDFDGRTVEPTDFATAPAMIVKDRNGKVIARYGFNETTVVELDAWAGKYKNAANEIVTVWGTGKITLADNTVGVYEEVADQDYNIVVRVYNEDDVVAYYEVKANVSDYTYEAVETPITVTYNLGDYGTNYTKSSYKGITYTLDAAPVPGDTNYTFMGWQIGDDTYAAGDKVVLTENTKVVALWAFKNTIHIVDEKYSDNNQTIYAPSTATLADVLEDYIPTAEGEQFYYWKVGDKKLSSTAKVGETELTVYVVWKEKYELTIVYGNGLEDGIESYFEGDKTAPKEPAATNGKVFDHWYTLGDDGETQTVYVAGSEITSDLTIYAAWIDAHIMYGRYLGFEVYSTNSAYAGATRGIEIDAEGKAVKESSLETVYYIKNNQLQVSNYNNGYFTFGDKESGNNYYYYGFYDEKSKILVHCYSAGEDKWSDVFILFKDATAVTVSNNNVLTLNNKNTKRLIEVVVTKDDVAETIFVYLSDNKIQRVTWIADDGMTQVSQVGSGTTAKATVLKIYDLTGNMIGDFAKEGSTFVELDGSQGTYTLEGGEDLVLTGTGSATIGTDKGTVTKAADGSTYTYDLYITQGGVNTYYELTIDKIAKTYSLNKPMVTISFDLDGKGTIASVSINKNIDFDLSVDAYKPTYDRFIFKGWYDSKSVDGETVTWGTQITKVTPTEDTVVYAKWAAVYTVTFVTQYGTAPNSLDKEENQWIDPSESKYKLQDTEDYAFYGWYFNGDTNNEIVTKNCKVTSDITFVALWKKKVTLTVVYDNAKATIDPIKIGPGLTIDFTEIKAKQYTENDQLYVVDKLYEDEAHTIEFTGSKIDSDKTIYVTWKAAHALYGTYKGAEYDPSDTKDASSTKSSHTTDCVIDGDGKVTKGPRNSGLTTTINDDGTLSFVGKNSYGNSTSYNGGYILKYGIFYYDYYEAKTLPEHDIYLFFKTEGDITSSYSSWTKGCTKLIAATYDGSTLNVFIYNRRIYGGVTFVAKDGDATITDISKVYTANTVYVLDDEGNWIAGFSKNNGELVYDETVKPATNA